MFRYVLIMHSLHIQFLFVHAEVVCVMFLLMICAVDCPSWYCVCVLLILQ